MPGIILGAFKIINSFNPQSNSMRQILLWIPLDRWWNWGTKPRVTTSEWWSLIGRTEIEAETPILWPPDAKNWLTGKDPDAGEDWGQEEEGTTEDEMVGWHCWLYEYELGWAQGAVEGQEGLACCGSWGRKETDMTEWMNWTELILFPFTFQGSEEKPANLARLKCSKV